MNILQRIPAGTEDDAIALIILRSKINDLLMNMSQLVRIPGIDLVRAPSTHASLQEVLLEVQDITRHRIEPLIARARSSGLTTNRDEVLQVLESQLAYDQRWGFGRLSRPGCHWENERNQSED
jgi:hypothetical protein